jgi:hypothetical protein
MAMASLIVSAAAMGGSVMSKRAQADIERGQAEVAADQEELKFTQREADRKDRLASAIASQNALSGARGVAAFEGSPLSILNDSIERERVATERDKFSTDLTALAMRSGAKVRQRLARVNAQIGMAQSIGSMMGSKGGGSMGGASA